jgi:hypothetical protein
VRPKDHIDILRPLLPDKYSPLQPNGNGLQSVYLTEVPTTLAEVLIRLIGKEVAPVALSAAKVKPISADDLDVWEKKLEQTVADDASIPETDRSAIVRARIGAIQRTGGEDRVKMPDHRRRESRSSRREPVELRAEGHGILKIGKKLGIGTSVVQRVFKQEPWQA